jgi:hypothetical protein
MDSGNHVSQPNTQSNLSIYLVQHMDVHRFNAVL